MTASVRSPAVVHTSPRRIQDPSPLFGCVPCGCRSVWRGDTLLCIASSPFVNILQTFSILSVCVMSRDPCCLGIGSFGTFYSSPPPRRLHHAPLAGLLQCWACVGISAAESAINCAHADDLR